MTLIKKTVSFRFVDCLSFRFIACQVQHAQSCWAVTEGLGSSTLSQLRRGIQGPSPMCWARWENHWVRKTGQTRNSFPRKGYEFILKLKYQISSIDRPIDCNKYSYQTLPFGCKALFWHLKMYNWLMKVSGSSVWCCVVDKYRAGLSSILWSLWGRSGWGAKGSPLHS